MDLNKCIKPKETLLLEIKIYVSRIFIHNLFFKMEISEEPQEE